MTHQNTIPFVKGSTTSRAAADSMKAHDPAVRSRVLGFILARGARGATDQEVEDYTGLRHQTASSTRRRLVLSGHVKDSGQTRLNPSGRQAVVWVAVEGPVVVPPPPSRPPTQAAQRATLADLRRLYRVARRHGLNLNPEFGQVIKHWARGVKGEG